MNNTVPILMYHQVSPTPLFVFRKYTVSPQAFAAQMHWLALAGYTPITLDALFESRQGRSCLPSRPVVITFDDGFQDCIVYAVPILKAHGFTAMFYLIAGLMGQTSHWLLVERGIELPLMNWSAARQLETMGFQCGSHTWSHPRLVELSSEACRRELEAPQQLYSDQLGHKLRHLSYPFGSYNETVRSLAAEAGYHTACTVQVGISTAHDDLLALHRVPITGEDSLFAFAYRLHKAANPRELLLGRVERMREWTRHKGFRVSA